MKDSITDNNSLDTYFDDFDFENATVIKHPMVKQLQDNKQEYERVSQTILSKLDKDVVQLINEHSSPKDIERMNTMFRLLFA